MSLRSTVWVHDRLCYSLRSCCSLRSVRGRSILSSGRIASSAMGSAGNCPRVVMHVGLGWLDLVINVSQTRSKDWIPACTAERHSHCTNMQNTLGYQSAPRIGKKCSGALKNTSHLGQKDARDKRAQGNDGQSAFCRPRERGGRCQRYLPPAWGARIDTRKMSFASTMAINRTATRVTLMERHRSRR